MDRKEIEAFARKAAKGIKTEKDIWGQSKNYSMISIFTQ